MSNSIKYSTGAETLALKKGNFYIGTGDVDKGPTSSTGYFDGVTPGSNQYVIYYNKSGSNRIYYCTNGDQVYLITNRLKGQNLTTLETALNYIATQSDMMCTNINYGPIVTDGLVLNLDAGFTPSYPRSGTTWYDLSENAFNANLVNGPIFVTTNGGGIQGDGTNDEIVISGATTFQPTDSFSIFAMLNWSSITNPGLDGNSTVFGRNPGNTVLGNYGIGINQTNLQLGMRTFSNQFLNTNIPYTFGTTTYVGWTYTPGQGKFYQNGDLVNTTNNPNVTGSTVTTDSWRVWAPRVVVGGSGRRSSGVLYVASVYNRALSETEVLQNWNALKGRFGL